jgi:hypothetical protein
MNESTLYSTVRNHSYRAPIHLLLTGGALFFFQVRRGRKTFCQSTVMSIGKFSLNSETSPGGEQNAPIMFPLMIFIKLDKKKIYNTDTKTLIPSLDADD